MEGVEVGAVMEAIRVRVEEKKASGFYTAEEIEEITRMELDLQEREGYGEEMDRLLSWLHSHWEATAPVVLDGTEPRRPLREIAKRTLRMLLYPATKLFLAKQNQINARVAQLLSGSLPALREGFRDLEESGDRLIVGLEKENRKLREDLDALAARLERLEKE